MKLYKTSSHLSRSRMRNCFFFFFFFFFFQAYNQFQLKRYQVSSILLFLWTVWYTVSLLNKLKKNKLVEFIYTEVIVVLIFGISVHSWASKKLQISHSPPFYAYINAQPMFHFCGAINCTLNANTDSLSW